MFVTVSSSIDEAPSSQLYRIMHSSSPPSVTTQYVGSMHQPTSKFTFIPSKTRQLPINITKKYQSRPHRPYHVTREGGGRVRSDRVTILPFPLLDSNGNTGVVFLAIAEDYRPPVLFNYKNSSGDTMYGMYYKPHHHEEGQKHPTVLFVYGGPKVQLVTNSYKGMR